MAEENVYDWIGKLMSGYSGGTEAMTALSDVLQAQRTKELQDVVMPQITRMFVQSQGRETAVLEDMWKKAQDSYSKQGELSRAQLGLQGAKWAREDALAGGRMAFQGAEAGKQREWQDWWNRQSLEMQKALAKSNASSSLWSAGLGALGTAGGFLLGGPLGAAVGSKIGSSFGSELAPSSFPSGTSAGSAGNYSLLPDELPDWMK